MSNTTPKSAPQTAQKFVKVAVPDCFEPAEFALKLEQGIQYLLRYGDFGVGELREDIVDGQDDYDMSHWGELTDEDKARLDRIRKEYVVKVHPSRLLERSEKPAKAHSETIGETPLPSFKDLQNRFEK